MPDHEYTASAALSLIINNIDQSSPDLMERIRIAIDAGKDIQAEALIEGGSKSRKNKRYYRRHVAYTDEEALTVAVNVLKAHLLESRMFANAALEEFEQVPLASPKRLDQKGRFDQKAELREIDFTSIGEEKAVVIESEPEEVLEKKNLRDPSLFETNPDEIKSLQALFEKLENLTDF